MGMAEAAKDADGDDERVAATNPALAAPLERSERREPDRARDLREEEEGVAVWPKYPRVVDIVRASIRKSRVKCAAMLAKEG